MNGQAGKRLGAATSRRVGTAFHGAIVAAVVGTVAAGCGAARDPDLEARALKVAVKAAVPAPFEESEAPAPPPVAANETPKAPPRETRRYSSAEIAEIMGRIEGSGPKLVATFETGTGTFSCELFEQDVGEIVTNFVGLATGSLPWSPKPGAPVRTAPFFDGTTFHRAIDQYIIQSGKVIGGGSGPGWRLERNGARNDLFDEAGALGMIDDGDGTHGSQFFVTLRPDASLAKRYVAFGRCDNLEVVRTIAAGEKKPARSGESASTPVEPVELTRVRVARASSGTP